MVAGKIWEGRERAQIWEERVQRRTGHELQDLIQEAIKRRLDREITAMAFKGSRPDKGAGSKGKDLVEQMQKTLDVQSRVIEVLALALEAAAATEPDDEDEDDEDEENDNDEEKEDK